MSSPQPRAGILDRWTAVILICAGIWHFWAAGRYTVFDDEAFSCRRYVLPMGEMISALYHGAEPDPPLYYIVQNLWVRMWGVGPVGLRSLSILLFLCGLVAIRAAAEAWFDRRTGIAAMVLAALHPAHLMLGFAARWYSAMFLGVALFLWATRRLTENQSRKRFLIWSFLAATLCYINYFGPIVVAILAGIGIIHTKRLARWILATVLAAILFVPWAGAYWQQLHDFRAGGGAAQGISSSAIRSAMALLAGNLASLTAWWVWGPMTIFAAGFCALLLRRRRAVWPIVTVVIGCFAAGALAGVMIEKYILCYSGIACILVAAILSAPSEGTRATTSAPPFKLVSLEAITIAALAIGWLGCAANLAREEYWSSLRWLDPFDRAISDILAQADAPTVERLFMEHSSAHYYYAINNLRGRDSGSPWQRIDPRMWNEFAARAGAQDKDMGERLDSLRPQRFDEVVTLEAADLAQSKAWQALMDILTRDYYPHQIRKYLPDPDWSLKDRLDPRYKHPQWRIIVRYWRRISVTPS